jgi:hypothetical protein
MLRLAADENLNNDIIRGLLRRRPALHGDCAYAVTYRHSVTQCAGCCRRFKSRLPLL